MRIHSTNKEPIIHDGNGEALMMPALYRCITSPLNFVVSVEQGDIELATYELAQLALRLVDPAKTDEPLFNRVITGTYNSPEMNSVLLKTAQRVTPNIEEGAGSPTRALPRDLIYERAFLTELRILGEKNLFLTAITELPDAAAIARMNGALDCPTYIQRGFVLPEGMAVKLTERAKAFAKGNLGLFKNLPDQCFVQTRTLWLPPSVALASAVEEA